MVDRTCSFYNESLDVCSIKEGRHQGGVDLRCLCDSYRSCSVLENFPDSALVRMQISDDHYRSSGEN